ncbi:MAG TPA: 50S ribosomal protein L11 methyltransferase [Thermodesulfobacteriota bacterium]|nr:50S ribosomal protein L11 methyltransferase [Thermodesulfobacteriota bacterium]
MKGETLGNKKWLELKARGRPETKDLAAALLIEKGSPGVLEGVDESGGSLVTGFIAAFRSEVLASLRQSLKAIGWRFDVSAYKDTDWEVEWKKYLKPVRAGVFFVKPTWKSVKKKKGLIVIDIDPGMAFGSGSHDTTKTCLKAISLVFRGPKSWFKNPVNETFLDVGAGSGILAIAAKKLGVKKVVAIDNDPIAIKVASGNAGLNKVKISVSRDSVSRVKGRFSVVVANIQSNTLLRLKKDIEAKVAPKGVLVLSGILASEVGEVKAAYEKTGLELNSVIRSREWRTLILKR